MQEITNFDLIKSGIIKGKYNLFLGAGASCECINKYGNKFGLGKDLAEDLCKAAGYSEILPLIEITDIYSTDKLEYAPVLESRYFTKKVSRGIDLIPKYVWNGIFTLNVDDAVEFSYDNSTLKQQILKPVNFNEPFQKEGSNRVLQCVHLHGFVRSESHEYIFSTEEYIQNNKSINTWMNVFTDLIKSEPFIISGCSLNELDMRHYLSFKNEFTARPNSYPSILVTPDASSYTRKLCEKYNLQLIEAKFDDFMKYLELQISNPLSLSDLAKKKGYEFANISEITSVIFNHDFEFIDKQKYCNSVLPSDYDFGFEPTIEDIFQNRDIYRAVINQIEKDILSYENNIVVITGGILNGKTSLAYRCLLDLSETKLCFKLKSLSGFNVKSAVECFLKIDKQVILFIDNIAEYVDQVSQLLNTCKNVSILGAERIYRIDHVKIVLGDNIVEYNVDRVKHKEVKNLIEKYIGLGKLKNSDVVEKSKILYGKTIGEQVCLITLNFVPIENKILSFINEFHNDQTEYVLTIVALCCACYKNGIHYDILAGMLPNSYPLRILFEKKDYFPFVLCFNQNDDDYVVPKNELFMSAFLNYEKSKNIQNIQRIYISLVKKLSNYVNKDTKRYRSPEYRLLARLVDADKNIPFFFPNKEEEFMNAILDCCGWNSRYWEQRALSIQGKDIDKALDYAEQAVALEKHPFTYTTYSKILFNKMKLTDGDKKKFYCEKALGNCLKAIKEESRRHMIPSIHPFMTLVSGLESYSKCMMPMDLEFQLCLNIDGAIESYYSFLKKRLLPSELERMERIQEYLRIDRVNKNDVLLKYHCRTN